MPVEAIRAGFRRIDLSRQAKELGVEFEERPSDLVAVVGFGEVTPFGPTSETAQAELEGRSGTTLFKHEYPDNPNPHAPKVAAQALFDPRAHFDRRELLRTPTITAMNLVVAREAAKMAGLLTEEGILLPSLASRRNRIAVSMPSGVGPALGSIDTFLKIQKGERTTAFEGLRIFPEQPTASAARDLKVGGWTSNSSEACATGLSSIADAWLRIRSGVNDIEIAGGSEDALSVHPEILAEVFGAIGAISTDDNDPRHASKPFNIHRAGFVPASGAGAIVLERLDSAIARGANIYAVILSARKGMDGDHPTNMNTDRIADVILQTLKDRNGEGFYGVDAIFAHATATLEGDPREIEALRKVFGDKLAGIPITAIKSMYGHLLGGAGVINAISAIRALHGGIIPPTINLTDSEIMPQAADLDIVTKARIVDIQTALAVAYGFGGYNAAVLFARYNKNN
ncbi:MAG: 3-oxoacyl-[acyl-carrier-protein] synthase 2 [Candidatus Levybacteria bacterium GW2011_GWB1_35_5]|nr:MAG: 3-oxoacyl-[acyl-carrier-protein] synthase 2 [Candidatus Levybacteria bacterium GW2011_GWB1_35_5]